MAHKPTKFKVNEKNKTIVIYSNITAPEEEVLINYYLGQGYKPMVEEKKPSITIKQMREELKKDEEVLAAFNAAYNSKEKTAFHDACKIYSKWKKENKGKK